MVLLYCKLYCLDIFTFQVYFIIYLPLGILPFIYASCVFIIIGLFWLWRICFNPFQLYHVPVLVYDYHWGVSLLKAFMLWFFHKTLTLPPPFFLPSALWDYFMSGPSLRP